MQRRASLFQGLLAVFAISQTVPLFGCAQPAGGGTGGTNGSGTGGSSSGTGGSSSGTGGSSSGSGGSSHTGGSNGTGGSSSGTGGIQGTGGSSSGSGGSSHTGGSTGSGGSSSGTGGMANGGAPGVGGARACAAASSDVIADFEDGTNSNNAAGSRQGWWTAFGDSTGTQTPASGTTTPSAAAAVTSPPSGDTCDMFAFHSTGTGHDTKSGYVGFGAPFNGVVPPPASGSTSKTQNPYDVSGYDGISFNIKSGSGTAPPVWVEFHNTENVPTPDGTAKYSTVDQYNTRGMLLTNVGATWTKVYAPFGLMAPRYLPSTTSSDCAMSSVVCQAPPWDSMNTLGIQFGVYPQFAVQPFTSSSSINYDLWVDDVTLYKGSDGLGTWTSSSGTAKPFPVDSPKVGSCTKPAGASGKYLIQAYNMWKKTFVTGSGSSTKVIRPENGNDTVSEGIGYGMLIAVYMGDKTLFDGLWGYGKSQSSNGLMNWCIPAGSGSCSASGGSATDADEDMAFALLEADKQWGGYATDALNMIKAIYAHDIDTAAKLPNGGSNFGNGMQTNPSYWAPAYYRAFAKVDSGDDWMTIVNNVYTALGSISGKSTGNAAGALVPAWCSGSNCSNVAGSGYTDGGVYQYDAHRVPWRFGLDVCWNGGSATFVTKNAAFFAGIAKTGIGRIADIYTLSGTANSDAAPNSMSIIGTAGVGAMAAGNDFANAAWQFLLDATYSPQSQIKDTQGHIAYTYFNATVGLITALTLSGNFNNF